MKKVIVISAVALAIMVSGCGHNVLAYSSGKYLNFGIDPNTGKTGIQYVNGEQITVVEKDNAILTVEMSDSLDNDGKRTQKVSKITYEIKEQVTGADVDLKQVE